jgi:hypothetical protein
MIFLRHLKGVMRLDLSKDISVHVSTCTNYDFQHINASCVEAVATIRRVVSTSRRKKKNLGFSQKRINVKLCAKLSLK